MVEAGIARDAKLGTPLECLHVALLDSAGRAVAHTVTDSAGQFLLEATTPGMYRVQFLVYRWEPLVGPVDTLIEGTFKQRIYPLAFTDMIVPDSSYERPPNGVRGRENRDKYKRMDAYLRAAESDSVWRSRRALPTDLKMRYPIKLGLAGADGSVLARFIVDSTGRARPESWVTLYAAHPDFEKAIRSSMPNARWRPARNAGQAVCELVMDYTRFFRDHEIANIVLETR